MSKTKQMQIRLEPELKAEAEAVLSQLGLKPTEFIRMALRQLVMRNGLPFDARIPNAETIAALEEPTNDLKRFGSPEELFADLEARSHAGWGCERFPIPTVFSKITDLAGSIVRIDQMCHSYGVCRSTLFLCDRGIARPV